MPCNFHLRRLAEKVKEGVRAAGGTPMEFNTVAISDGITMGTEGMKTSLVSREVIADSIELVVRGHMFDAVIALSGCDKTIPGCVMALARLDVPGLMLYGGSIAPGRWRGKDVTIQDVFEGIGAHAAGDLTDEELDRPRGPRLAGRRRLRRPVHREHDGDGVRGARDLARWAARWSPPRTARRARSPRSAGGSCSRCSPRTAARARSSPSARSRTRSRPAPPRAARPTSCCTCWRWRARRGWSSTLEDFDRIAWQTPLLCDLKPGGRYVATDLYRAGGVPLVIRRLKELGALHEDELTVTGQTIGEVADAAEETEGQDVVRAVDNPIKPNGGFAILRGNLAPEGCVVKLSGHDRMEHRGPARVFEREEDAFAAVMAKADRARRRGRDPKRGPEGRPGHARDAPRDGGARGRGPRRQRRAPHRRPLLRRDARLHGGPRGARGAGRRPDRGGPRRRHDRVRRGQARAEPGAPGGRDRGAHRRVRAPAAGVHERRARQVQEAGGLASEGAVTG